MGDHRVKISKELTIEENQFWEEALRHRHFGELVLPWTEAIRRSRLKNVEFYYLQVDSKQGRQALVILHVLRNFDLSQYIGKFAKYFFSFFSKLGWKPLALDLAFVEIPVGNLSGICFAPGAESQSQEIAQAVLPFIRKEFDYDVFCLKSTPALPGEQSFDRLGLPRTDFLANMRIEFKGEKNFEEYLKRIDSKIRTQCRSYSREFKAAGGTIEIVESPDEALLETINRLYANTLLFHEKNSNLQLPVPLGAEFFHAIVTSLKGKSRFFIAQLNGEPVGFSLVLDCGSSSFFTHCGLNYERTVPTRGYFNLYYAMIEDSIRRGVLSLNMGAEGYVVKRKLGAVAHRTVYYFEAKNRMLQIVASLVARNFSAQEGSQVVPEKNF